MTCTSPTPFTSTFFGRLVYFRFQVFVSVQTLSLRYRDEVLKGIATRKHLCNKAGD